MVQFSTTLTYSSDDGAITAAAVIAQVSFIVMSSPKGLQLGNNGVIINLQHSNSNRMPSRSLNVIGAGVGGFVGGFVLAMFCLGIILAIFCIRYVYLIIKITINA